MTENLYTKAVIELPKKVVEYIDYLDKTGQIDRDSNGDPLITFFGKEANGFRVKFSRNDFEENFFMNPRKRPQENGLVEPIRQSWDEGDGWVRQNATKSKLTSEPDNPRKERAMKVSEAYIDIVKRIIE